MNALGSAIYYQYTALPMMMYKNNATKFTGAAALLLVAVAGMGKAEAAACRVLFNGLNTYPAAQSLILNGVNVVPTNSPSAISNFLSGPSANLPQYDAIWLHWYNATYSSASTPSVADAAALVAYLGGGGRVHFTQDYGNNFYNEWAVGVMNARVASGSGGGSIATGPNSVYGGAWTVNSAAIGNIDAFPFSLGASVMFDNGGVLLGPIPAQNRLAYQMSLSDPAAPISVAAFGEADMNGNAGRITYFGDGGNLGGANQTDANMQVIKNLQAFLLAPSACRAPLAAQEDSGTMDAAGGIAISNVLANDDMNPGGLHGQVVPTLGSVVTMAELPGTNTSPAGFPMVLDTNTGSVSLSPATPPGTYSLDYQYCQISKPDNCATATATVTVSGPTELSAVNDLAYTTQGQPVSIDVRANDTTVPAAQSIGVPSISQQPSHGSVSVDGSGNMVYTPDAGFSGTDSFDYQVCLEAAPSECKPAVVTVRVLGVTATADSASTAINTPVTIRILDNDASSDATSAPLGGMATGVSAPAHGAVAYNADGSASYTPASGFSGTDTFTYQICSLQGPYPQPVCQTAMVTVVVSPVQTPSGAGPVQAVPVDSPWVLWLVSMGLVGLAARRYRLR
ncbi:Ig-like domain-containing protein [Comamonas sp. MYb69]|uniref:Ig-like domain-containing protein n=1 Tax=Comamonas sp. MYb69 TaxID=1848650 RepID=UPI0030A77F7B